MARVMSNKASDASSTTLLRFLKRGYQVSLVADGGRVSAAIREPNGHTTCVMRGGDRVFCLRRLLLDFEAHQREEANG